VVIWRCALGEQVKFPVLFPVTSEFGDTVRITQPVVPKTLTTDNEDAFCLVI